MGKGDAEGDGAPAFPPAGQQGPGALQDGGGESGGWGTASPVSVIASPLATHCLIYRALQGSHCGHGIGVVKLGHAGVIYNSHYICTSLGHFPCRDPKSASSAPSQGAADSASDLLLP